MPEGLRNDLFQLGEFTLNSGAKSEWKLECDALTPGDLHALSKMIAILVGPFNTVEGVPRGGVMLAGAVSNYKTWSANRHLIVDDVLTTGGSLERAKTAYRVANPGSASTEVIGAVVFARGQRPVWVSALFSMPEVFWTKPRHR